MQLGQQMNHALPHEVITHYVGPNSGAVTMLLNKNTAKSVAFGTFDLNAKCEPEDMIFEIGSITKVFTAILLAVLIEEGEIDPDRPIKDLNHELSDVPPWITLRSLATHTSGLPRLHVPIWKALIFSMPDDPYAEFSRTDLIDWLRIRSRRRPPKHKRHAYSNVGYGLLGEAMAISAGKPYLELLSEKVLNPIGMADTASDLRADQQVRFMRPRDTKGRLVTPWTFKAIAAAGCLRSTARDISRFSAFVLNALASPETSLDRAINRTVEPVVGLGLRGANEPVAQCLGWLSMKMTPTVPRMLFHNGGTAGSTAALYLCPEKMAAALVLSNRGVAANVWSSMKLNWTNPDRKISDLFVTFAKADS